MNNDQVLLQFLDMLKNAPTSVLLIAFAMWMLKKYLINGSATVIRQYADKYLDVQVQHDTTTQSVVNNLITVTRQLSEMTGMLKENYKVMDQIAQKLGRRIQDD